MSILEVRHHFLLLNGFHLSMQKSETQIGEYLTLKMGCHLCGGFEFLQFFGLLNEWIDDVRLSAALDFLPNGAV